MIIMTGTRTLTYSLLLLLVSIAGTVSAQVGGYGIPSTYDVLGEDIQSGDIISFDPAINTYTPSIIPGDENMFGVVDTTPVVVFRSGINRVPIVQAGEVFVNVTTLNGAIAVGDGITTSEISGKGQRSESDGGYILGYALQSFDETQSATTTIASGGGVVAVGSIRVLLDIGPLSNEFNEQTSQSTIFVREGGEVETGLETIFRYITAALFALGTVFVVLKTFGPNIGRGVISVGRNPLAKTSIQAMVVFNVILILSISIVAFIISLLIIFLPI